MGDLANDNLKAMLSTPRSTPALASRLPKLTEELEEDYHLFLRWVQTGCPPDEVLATMVGAPVAFISLCRDYNSWYTRLEESEYGAEVQAIEARTARFLQTVESKGASGAVLELVKRKIAQLAVMEHSDGGSDASIKDLVAALKQLQEYERLEQNLSTQNIAVQTAKVGLTDEELDTMTDEEVEAYRNMLSTAKARSEELE